MRRSNRGHRGSAMDLQARYQESLSNLPTPGCGDGCHGAILGTANRGALAGRSPEEVFEDLRRAIPRGKRPVSDREVADAINKAFSEHADGCFVPRSKPKPIVRNGAVVLRRLIEQGRGATEEGIRAASPVPIPDRPEYHTKLLGSPIPSRRPSLHRRASRRGNHR